MRNLSELDVFAAQAVRTPLARLAVHDLWTDVRRQVAEGHGVQHVAGQRTLVTENAVEKQVVGRAVVNAEQRGTHPALRAPLRWRGTSYFGPLLGGVAVR